MLSLAHPTDSRSRGRADPTHDAALARCDVRAASQLIAGLAESGNRFIEPEAPWHLAMDQLGVRHMSAKRAPGGAIGATGVGV